MTDPSMMPVPEVAAAPALPLTEEQQQQRSLYVGSLSSRVNEALLWEIFNTVGRVETLKIIRDKLTNESLGYGFVDYYTHEDAVRALNQLNGVDVYGGAIKVSWAVAGGSRDEGANYQVFVGDLSVEVTDQILKDAFKAYPSLIDARVMVDRELGKSRGYGFASFKTKEDAEQAIRDMNGVWLGTKAIRCNWANARPATPGSSIQKRADYDTVVSQTSPYNTTVYVGNLPPEITQDVLRNEFIRHGAITEVRTTDKGFGFIVYQTHEAAARAISALHGSMILGRQIRCSWGKDPAGGAGKGMPAVPPPYPPYPAYPPAYPGYPPYPPHPQPGYPPYPQAPVPPTPHAPHTPHTHSPPASHAHPQYPPHPPAAAPAVPASSAYPGYPPSGYGYPPQTPAPSSQAYPGYPPRQ